MKYYVSCENVTTLLIVQHIVMQRVGEGTLINWIVITRTVLTAGEWMAVRNSICAVNGNQRDGMISWLKVMFMCKRLNSAVSQTIWEESVFGIGFLCLILYKSVQTRVWIFYFIQIEGFIDKKVLFYTKRQISCIFATKTMRRTVLEHQFLVCMDTRAWLYERWIQ